MGATLPSLASTFYSKSPFAVVIICAFAINDVDGADKLSSAIPLFTISGSPCARSSPSGRGNSLPRSQNEGFDRNFAYLRCLRY